MEIIRDFVEFLKLCAESTALWLMLLLLVAMLVMLSLSTG